MEVLRLPRWTLGARLNGDALEFSLGDGRRLDWRSRCAADRLVHAHGPMPAEQLLGSELAGRLAGSPVRLLYVQYEAALDGVAWEWLGLGGARLAEQFALGRQVLGEAETAPVPEAGLAEALRVTSVGSDAAHGGVPARHIGLNALGQGWARELVATSHVLILEGVRLADLLERSSLPARECLLVVARPEPARTLIVALDAGAAVVCLGGEGAAPGESSSALLRLLGSGQCIGEAVRWLHRRAASTPCDVRLYGDPAMRFVRSPVPTSRRQVTSLSFDLVGSTTMLQRLGDESYAEMLSRLHERCTGVVRRHGGRPDDPQGDDGVMCYFGHPLALEDAAERAVRAGLDVMRTVAELGVSIRVGIATGLVAIKDDQPVGLSIHLAARLQQVAAPGTILVAESTRRLVAHAFELKMLDARPQLKGIDASQAFFRLVAPRRDAQAHRLERLPVLTPMVGRHAELEILQRCWQRTRVGECQLAVVRGEAGMGKSRLVREFRRALVHGEVKVLECRCRADASASPFLTLAEALRRWLDIAADEGGDDALRKLAAALPEHARGAEDMALLAAVLGIAQPGTQVAAGKRRRLLSLLLEWLSSFAGDRPCCLLVEDWQWVDPSLREFIGLLARRSGGPGLLIVITVRSETSSPPLPLLPSERRASIELAGLPPEASRELVQQACTGAMLPSGLARRLAARGDGVPLFLEEAARMALDAGAGDAGGDFTALESVPASLLDLLTARLDGLGPAKGVAQVAAVVGREFSRPLLAALLAEGSHATDEIALDEHLDVLMGSGLVRTAGGGQFAFKHALVRDAAYASLWARDRHALHARVVELLQQRWPEQASLRPELLALHETEAGLYQQALAHWELAASHAASRSAEQEAISHLRRALGVLARLAPGTGRDRTALRLQLLLAARQIATEGYGAEAVLHAYREAERLCDGIGDETARFKVEMGLEAYRFMRADFEPALEHGRRAAGIAARSGDAKQRLQAHWGLACTLFHQGQLRQAMREMECALALYTPAMHAMFGVQDPGVMCMAYSSWGLWELGRPDAALARIEHAVAIAGEFKHKFSQAVAMAYAVSVELLRGETAAALARAEACMRVCEEGGFPVWLAITRCMRGYLLCEQGQFDAGLPEMRAGHALWLSTGALVSQPLYLALQAEGCLLAGQLDAAAACIDEGLAITSRYGERQLVAELGRLRGELALRRGDLPEAEAWLRRACAQAVRQRRLGFALRSATALARLWAASGRADRARRLLAPLAGRWSEGRQTRDVRAALALAASLDSHRPSSRGPPWQES